MPIVRFMLQAAGASAALVALMGVAAAAINGALIALIHRAVSSEATVDGQTAGLFVVLALARLGLNYGSGRMLTIQAQRSVNALRKQLVQTLLSIDFASLQRIGDARVLNVLTQDVGSISALLQIIPNMLVSFSMVLGGGVYLAYLSPPLFGVLTVAGVAAAVVAQSLRRRGHALQRRAREESDALLSYLQSSIGGAKELKMHGERRARFLADALARSADAYTELRIDAQTRFLGINALNGAVQLLVIGIVLFWLGSSFEPRLLSGYVLTSLFIMGPSGAVVRSLSGLSSASVALKRAEAVGLQLLQAPREGDAPTPAQHFDRVELRGVTFRHAESDFRLGPVDLSLQPGQLTLVSGDNGSGKSTLLRVLTGLYPPQQGSLHWDGAPVDDDNRDRYRQLFSVVFYDFHLFDALYGLQARDLEPRADALLAELGLQGLVRVEGGALQHPPLSSGQRRRLALLTALLEARPVCVLDEPTADQDPSFRAYLRDTLIPTLKASGKCIVLVTHDDASWEDCDQHLVLAGGVVQAERA